MKRLVLVGGGHAHLHVLKHFAGANTRITLISPHSRQIYSGMLPGWIAGHYTLAQCAIDLDHLSTQASFVREHVIGIDPERKLVLTEKSGVIPYDVLSIDIGAETDISSLAATETVLCPIRPLEHFVLAWDKFLDAACLRGSARLIVAGGGAAGVELALACRHRLSKVLGADHNQVSLVGGDQLLPGHGARITARVMTCLTRNGIEVHQAMAAGEGHGVRLSNGWWLDADFVIAATGVRPAPWLAKSGLALSRDGFIAVGATQQSISHPAVFAAGDVASRVDTPHPKSGVYAVRAGPVLSTNLLRMLNDEPPLPYVPQARSLYLLATGGRHAIMSWSGFSLSGHWVWGWKDWIDRRFVAKYTDNS
jgi:pyridine nucleotide-disulfide oxidoreductase family protein